MSGPELQIRKQKSHFRDEMCLKHLEKYTS